LAACIKRNTVIQNAFDRSLVRNGLSDERVEAMVNDSLSAMRFCGLCIEDDVPDHSVLSRFRSELTQKKSFDGLLKKINRQLLQHGVILKHGAGIMYASITESPF
jgi:IS5 family transposase